MKRMMYLLLVCLLAVVVLVSCGSKYGDEPPFLPETNTKPGISLEIVDMRKGPWGKRTVTVRISNNTEHTVIYGKDYQLLCFNGTSWKEAKHIPYHVTLEAYFVEPGESREQTFVLTSRYFVNERKQNFFTMRLSEERSSGGYEEFQYGVLLDPEAWQ